MSKKTPENKKTLLMVDDRYDLLSDYIKSLRTVYHVELAESLDEAVDILKSTDIGGVLIDLYIPGNSGLDSYRLHYEFKNNEGQSLGLYLKKNFSTIKYVYLTNFANNLTHPENGEQRLSKDIPPKELVTFCKNCFGT